MHLGRPPRTAGRHAAARTTRCVALCAVLVATTASVACSAGTRDQGATPPRPPSLEEAVADSVAVVQGEVVDRRGDLATVRVDEVLAAADGFGSPATVRVRTRRTPLPGPGIWVLGDGDPAQVLLAPPATDPFAVRRVLSGRPANPEPPGDAEVRALADRSELVVFGRIDATSTGAATVEVEEVLKAGDAVTFEPGDDLAVVRPDGAQWDFPTSAPGYGTLFLRRDPGTTTWVVLDEQAPHRYLPAAVADAVG